MTSPICGYAAGCAGWKLFGIQLYWQDTQPLGPMKVPSSALPYLVHGQDFRVQRLRVPKAMFFQVPFRHFEVNTGSGVHIYKFTIGQLELRIDESRWMCRGLPTQLQSFRGHLDGVTSFALWGTDMLSAGGNKIGLSSLSKSPQSVSVLYLHLTILKNHCGANCFETELDSVHFTCLSVL